MAASRTKQMQLRILLIALLSTTLLWSQAPVLSSDAQISVITCGPGDELYTAFGHSAFRVQDPVLGIDVIYNYGTFDFNAPNFYMNFARGKLMYALSRQRFENFLYNYQLENRWVKEQLLELTTTEKNNVFQFLETNYLPENREYLYDFLYNNCATKIPEVLQLSLGPTLEFEDNFIEETATFRELIRSYLYTNSWASFGIDLALGAVVDKPATAFEHTFLPDYVWLQIKNTTLDNIELVTRERNILEFPETKHRGVFTASPLFWLLILLLFTVTITIIDWRNNVRSRFMDFTLYTLTGLVGLVMILLWFFTNHTSTAFNLNVLWAVPFHFVLGIILLRRRTGFRWLPAYLQATLGLLGLAIVCWVIGIQSFSPLVSVLITTLAVRTVFLLRHFRQFPVEENGK